MTFGKQFNDIVKSQMKNIIKCWSGKFNVKCTI